MRKGEDRFTTQSVRAVLDNMAGPVRAVEVAAKLNAEGYHETKKIRTVMGIIAAQDSDYLRRPANNDGVWYRSNPIPSQPISLSEEEAYASLAKRVYVIEQRLGIA